MRVPRQEPLTAAAVAALDGRIAACAAGWLLSAGAVFAAAVAPPIAASTMATPLATTTMATPLVTTTIATPIAASSIATPIAASTIATPLATIAIPALVQRLRRVHRHA